MAMNSGRRKIDYECNNCKKTRVIYVLPSLHHEVDKSGYVEYVDIHACLDDKLNANILYVDKAMVVRSQVPIKVGDDLTTEEISSLQIPVPKKLDLKEVEISTIKEFRYKNLKSMEIVDRLRQTQFVLKKKGDGKTVAVSSELEFIDIKIIVSKSIDIEIAEDWLKQIASILEAIVLLDEEMLSYIVAYLDPKLDQTPTGDSIIEIDLILHAKSSFPIATLKSYATFRRQWSTIQPDFEEKEFPDYEKLITYCIGNQYKTLLDIYFKAMNSLSFNSFIDRIEDLAMLGLVNIRKTEFFTANDD
ncbi:MAG: hypothetical protein V3V41_08275 [Candidatus Heimdallarchaeota archaeon]